LFINVGRGDVMKTQDLVAALDIGLFSNAVLDVTEKEPLPEDSELWGHARCKITPHVSAVRDH
jgi:phosphoglycerate dehydrogenase-like enzyme